MPEWSGDTGLAALFASAFLSATILPGNSEIVLLAVLKSFPDRAAAAIAVATVGNTLGGFSTYLVGRILPNRLPKGRGLVLVERYGAVALLLSWVPLLGDALCAAAGWLRVPWPAALLTMAAGKLVRYVAVAQVVSLL